MRKQRWRTIKKTKTNPPSQSKQPQYSFKQIWQENFMSLRLKAFLTDLFMIYTPILYITTYIILDGAQDFRSNQMAIFLCLAVYAIIYSIFVAISAQTPGLKYVRLKLVHTNGSKVGFLRCLIRFFLWLVGVVFIVGILSAFFLKNHRFLHDTLTHTKLIKIP